MNRNTVAFTSKNFRIYTTASLLIAAMFVTTSCAGSSAWRNGTAVNTAASHFALRVHSRTWIEPLFPGNTGEAAKARLTIILALLSFPENKALDALVRNTFYGGLSSSEYGEGLFARYRREYRAAAEELKVQPDESVESFNWSLEEKMKTADLAAGDLPGDFVRLLDRLAPAAGTGKTPAGPAPALIVISRFQDSYTGGAHGNYETQYLVVEPRSLKALTLDDLFTQAGKAAVEQIMIAKLREHLALAPDTPLSEGGLFTDEPALPESFYISPQGLTLHFNIYEITPYTMGEIDLPLGWDELLPLIKQ